jgi:hypothetical protein
MSGEDSRPECLEYSLSLPDFKFVEFAGLDGFDRRNCVWLPQSNYETTVGDNGGIKSTVSSNRKDSHAEENEDYSNLNKSRKTITGHCTNNNNSTNVKEKSNVQFPLIHDGTYTNVNKRCCPGQLVYESPRNACKEAMITKMDKIKAFGGARNSSQKLHRGKNCCLPPLNGVARLSSSVHCQPFSSNESTLRKNYVAYKIKSLGAISRESGIVPLIPWKGRSFPRVDSTTQSQRDGLNGKKSLVKKCGGGGYATGVGRAAFSPFTSQAKPSSLQKSKSGEPRAPLKPFRF